MAEFDEDDDFRSPDGFVVYFKNGEHDYVDMTHLVTSKSRFIYKHVREILSNKKSSNSLQMPETVSLDDFKCLKEWSDRAPPKVYPEKGTNKIIPPPFDLSWWNNLSDEQKKRMLPAAIALEMPDSWLINNIRKQLEEEKLL